jgi:hypothetical protein
MQWADFDQGVPVCEPVSDVVQVMSGGPFGLPKAYRIFQSAIEEIGAAKLVEALAEAKDAEWTYHALLYYIPNLSEAQRTTLYDVFVAAKNAEWAYWALRHIRDLTEAQRSALQKIASGA